MRLRNSKRFPILILTRHESVAVVNEVLKQRLDDVKELERQNTVLNFFLGEALGTITRLGRPDIADRIMKDAFRRVERG